ncbi:MAG TPA: pirin family protein, partial [Terriglobales bacterium]
IVDGELSHRDSTGREATIGKDDVQRMSAGTGVVHSEYNNSKAPVHLLQIWIMPEAEDLPASYEDRTFSRAEKQNRLRLIASQNGREDSTRINQDASVYASLLESGKTLDLDLKPGRYAWVQAVKGELEVNGTRLKMGDGAAISNETKLTLVNVSGNGAAEFLVFDLA